MSVVAAAEHEHCAQYSLSVAVRALPQRHIATQLSCHFCVNFAVMDNTTKRSPSATANDELLAAREVAKEKQAKAAQAIKEAEEALAEISRLSGVESQKKLKRGEKSPSPATDSAIYQIPKTPMSPSDIEAERELDEIATKARR